MLGLWARGQRTAYRADSLSQDRIDRLNSIGFSWTLFAPWKARFDELVKYKAKHGDCDFPQRQGLLGGWVHRQRNDYKRNKLSQDRIDCLNDIGFDWTPPRGCARKRNALPSSSRVQSSSSQMRLSRPYTNTNMESLYIGARTIVGKPNMLKGKGFGSEHSLPMQIPPNKSNTNLGTESDDEFEEIGALIYDQVMRHKGKSKEMTGLSSEVNKR